MSELDRLKDLLWRLVRAQPGALAIINTSTPAQPSDRLDVTVLESGAVRLQALRREMPEAGSIWVHRHSNRQYRVLGGCFIEAGAIPSVRYRLHTGRRDTEWVRPLKDWYALNNDGQSRFIEVQE